MQFSFSLTSMQGNRDAMEFEESGSFRISVKSSRPRGMKTQDRSRAYAGTM